MFTVDKIVNLYRQGESIIDIAEQVGMTYKNVNNLLQGLTKDLDLLIRVNSKVYKLADVSINCSLYREIFESVSLERK
jgi:predicted transcriptional regulator